jgi:hypothetical protein
MKRYIIFCILSLIVFCWVQYQGYSFFDGLIKIASIESSGGGGWSSGGHGGFHK